MNDNNNIEPNTTITESQFETTPKNFKLLAGALMVLIVAAILYTLVDDSREIVIIDESDQVIIDDTITITRTPVFLRDLESNLASDQELLLNSEINNERAYVTEVLSDRLFRISETNRIDGGILMYLDDSLDLGQAETVVKVSVGDVVTVSGIITNDLSDQTLESDESNTIDVEGFVLLVEEIEFI